MSPRPSRAREDDAEPTPSPELALARAAGRDTATRDLFIARAAVAGESPSTIASYLHLSRQQVYAVLDAHRQVAEVGADADASTGETAGAWQATEHAIEQMTSGADFEKLVQVLLHDIDSSVRPLGGVDDQARDAVADLAGGDGSIYSISLEREWSRKIKRELGRIKEFGHAPTLVYGVTNRQTTRAAERRLEEWAAERGITLRVLGQRWLVTKLLHPSYLELRREFLGLAPPRPTVFLTPYAYRNLLNGRPANQGLDIDRVGRDALLAELRQRVSEQSCVVLHGAGGVGKTRVVLDLAESAGEFLAWRFLDELTAVRDDALGELVGGQQLVVVIDNAHRRDDLRHVLALLERRQPQPKVVFVARPRRLDRIEEAVGGSWLGPLEEASYIVVPRLANRDISQLVKGPPFELDYEGMVHHIVALAEGNPLVAILAAGLARDGRPVAELSRASVFAQHVAALLGTVTGRSADARQLRELLAVISAIGSISASDAVAMQATANLLGFAPQAIGRWLDDLADLGLIVEAVNGSVAIKPDLLAEHVLVSLFFSDRWRTVLDYSELTDAFSPSHVKELCDALGRVPHGELDPNHPGLRTLRKYIHSAVAGGPVERASELVRALLPGAEDLVLAEFENLVARVERDPSTLTADAGEALVEATQRVNSDLAYGWRLLLRVMASATEPKTLEAARSAMRDVYKRVPVHTSSQDGQILAGVQHILATVTRAYARHAQTAGELRASAAAGQALMITTFESSFMSPEDDRMMVLRAYALPASAFTEDAVGIGLDTVIATFERVDAAEALRGLQAATELARLASGFTGPFGLTISEDSQAMSSKLLNRFDAFLNDRFDAFTLPVQAEALSYLLARRAWADQQPETPERLDPAARPALPARSLNLDEYLLVIYGRDVEPPSDRQSWDERQRAKDAQCEQVARRLSAPDWRERLARWAQWLELARELDDRNRSLNAVSIVLLDLAGLDPGRTVEVVDELIRTDSPLRRLAVGSINQLVRSGYADATTLSRWASADENTRAVLATAIAEFDEKPAAVVFRGLARDESVIVRRGVLHGLRYGPAPTEPRIAIGLEIAGDLADIDELNVMLMLAEHGGLPISARLGEIARDALMKTACLDRIDDHDLSEVLRRLEPVVGDLTLAWVWQRIEWLTGDRMRAWTIDLLPESIADRVHEHGTTDDLDRALREWETVDGTSAAGDALVRLIEWLAPGDNRITDFIARFYDDPDERWRARRLLRLNLTWEECQQRAVALADRLDEQAVTAMVDKMLPDIWSGSRVPALEAALEHVNGWRGERESMRFRRATAAATVMIEQMIAHERERERREDEFAVPG